MDALNLDPSGATAMAVGGAVMATPVMLILGYTLARVGASFCSEARNAVFATVSSWFWWAGWFYWGGSEEGGVLTRALRRADGPSCGLSAAAARQAGSADACTLPAPLFQCPQSPVWILPALP